jgi:hypothetical protein
LRGFFYKNVLFSVFNILSWKNLEKPYSSLIFAF